MNLDFHITEYPKWRENKYNLGIEEMLKDIAEYMKSFKMRTDPILSNQKLREIRVKYIVNTQIEEDIGVKTQEETLDIIEEMIEKSLQVTDVSDKKKQETVNLYKGLVYLEKLISKENCSTKEEDADLDKLLDIKDCIQKAHEILTTDVLSDEMIPGQFSTCRRYREFDNKIYHYPHFKTEKIPEEALQSIVDEYHKHLFHRKEEIQKPMSLELLKKIFKVATLFLFTFLHLHPFSNGNGRLGRLLCSYILELFSPFPTVIYNVFSSTYHGDFIQTLVNARIALNNTNVKYEQVVTENEAINITFKYLAASLSDLCALIIESNWCTWKELMTIDQ